MIVVRLGYQTRLPRFDDSLQVNFADDTAVRRSKPARIIRDCNASGFFSVALLPNVFFFVRDEAVTTSKIQKPIPIHPIVLGVSSSVDLHSYICKRSRASRSYKSFEVIVSQLGNCPLTEQPCKLVVSLVRSFLSEHHHVDVPRNIDYRPTLGDMRRSRRQGQQSQQQTVRRRSNFRFV